MPITMRPYTGDADKPALLALVRAYPAGRVHVADLPYRLSSWAFDYPENIGLWIDGTGELIAWAVLQTPFWTLDYAFSTEALALGIFPQIITWAIRRAAAIAAQPNGRPRWFVAAFMDQTELIGDLERAGFSRAADWSQVYLTRPAGELAPPQLPPGFLIRPLAGAAEVAAYTVLHRAAFGSANMTAAWRARTLQAPEYNPNTDLVAVAPDGRLAAFAVGWLGQEEGAPTGQIEPLGVHPDFQRLGLGHAVLWACLRQLVQAGAQKLIAETDNSRDAALALYTSAGFAVERTILLSGRDAG